VSSILSNSLAMLAARLLVPLFSFGISIGVARLLGTQVLGQYVELVALLFVAQALAGSGLAALVTRDVAAQPGERAELVRRANRVGIASGALATVLFLVYVRLLLEPTAQRPALLLAVSILPSAWIATQEGLFMGVHLHHRITATAFVEGVVKLSAGVVVLAVGGGLAGLCAGLTLARLVAFAFGHVFAARAGAERSLGSPAGGTIDFARAAVPFAVIGTMGVLYFRQDVLVVGALRSQSETGFYGVATALYAMTLLVPGSVMSAVYPRLASVFAKSRDAYHEATVLATKVLTVFCVVMAIAMIAVAPWLVSLLYGTGYLAAVPVFSLLAATFPLHAANGTLGQAMQAGHLEREMLLVTVGTVILNLALNLALVPRLGIEGAALSILISSGLALLVLGWIYHRRVAPLSMGMRSLLAPVAMAGPLVLLLVAPDWMRLPGAVLGLLVVAAGARLSGLLAADDLDRLLAAFGARSPRAEGGNA
jgi:O-antigen/teichoic acid export membrane protein